MNLLLNQDEIIQPLARKMLMKHLRSIKISWDNVDEYVDKCQQRYQRSGLIEIDFKEVNTLISRDITAWRQKISAFYKQHYKPIAIWIRSNPTVLDRFSKEELIEMCTNDEKLSFAKGLGKQLTKNPHWVVKHQDLDITAPLLVRNIINNEKTLEDWIQCNREFWFVDSGYTNFLTGKQKIWHRLVKNNIHHSSRHKSFPTDRLNLLSCFPEAWRRKGETILVIESSPQHYAMKGVTVEQWRTDIQAQIAQHTNRPIEFRPKDLNRKTRNGVYELLKNNNSYYCVISDSSAAAIEAIWCGVPVITLSRHITDSVSRNNISQINDLYYGSLGDWLCTLTYSQWTFEELMSGHALKMIRKYNHV